MDITDQFLLAAHGFGFKKAQLDVATHLLAEHPEIGSSSIATAATAGDLQALQRLLGTAGVDDLTGPRNATALTYVASSCLGSSGQLACARWRVHGAVQH